MIPYKNISLVVVFFTFLTLSYSQSQKSVSVISILDRLEKQFGCRFSFVNKDLENISLLPPKSDLSLKEIVLYLETNSGLDFVFVKEKEIAIRLGGEKTIPFCGTVLSFDDDSPIVNAAVKVNNDIIFTDTQGAFSVDNTSENTLITISYKGFVTKEFLIKDMTSALCEEIRLLRSVETLEEVFITNYLVKGINKRNDGAILINYSDFGLLPGLVEPDLLQTVQALPGILSVNETVANINVRGGTNDQNLMLWDGIKMYQSGHFFGLISAFNPYLTNDVTCLLYTSDAADD